MSSHGLRLNEGLRIIEDTVKGVGILSRKNEVSVVLYFATALFRATCIPPIESSKRSRKILHARFYFPAQHHHYTGVWLVYAQ